MPNKHYLEEILGFPGYQSSSENHGTAAESAERLLPGRFCPFELGSRSEVNIIALGDVGTTMLTGLRLLGGDVISTIGIYDVNSDNLARLEMEINQIRYPFSMCGCSSPMHTRGSIDTNSESVYQSLPPVRVISESEIFDCDIVIFCASRGVPPVDGAAQHKDVRMAQLDANREIIEHYGEAAKGFAGMIAVVSDPVDNLSAALMDASGLNPSQIQGFGLGVMNARAEYYAERDPRFISYLTEGRAYGPHGQDLVIANSITNYDDALSRELTDLVINANLKVRSCGYKPYIAPALSSAAISILLMLRGQWHYSSVYMGGMGKGAFLGIKNRMTAEGTVIENLRLPDALVKRISASFEHLCETG